MAKPKYIFAFDRKIKKRVTHKVVNGKAVSLVTGSKFTYKSKKKRRVKKKR